MIGSVSPLAYSSSVISPFHFDIETMEDHHFHLSTALTLGVSNRSTTASTSTCHFADHQVSTDLVLCDPTWNWSLSKQRKTEEPNPLLLPKRKIVKKTKRTEPGNVDNQGRCWTIRKKLTATDLGNCSRLLIPIGAVRKHVMPHLDSELAERVHSSSGAKVSVHDCDENSTYQLTFKYWTSSGSYVLNGDWRQVLVHGKDLKENDEIGLHWDVSKSRFEFKVLARAKSMPVLMARPIASYNESSGLRLWN